MGCSSMMYVVYKEVNIGSSCGNYGKMTIEEIYAVEDTEEEAISCAKFYQDTNAYTNDVKYKKVPKGHYKLPSV